MNKLRLRNPPPGYKADEVPEEYRLPPGKLLEEMWGTDVREVSGVDMPAIDWPFLFFKSATYGPGTKPADVEACVDAILADPSFQPQEGRTPEESAFAICQAQAQKWRREHVAGTNRKQEPMPEGAEEPMAPPGEEVVASTVELPASPVQWPFSQCIAEAMELQMGRDDATAVCTVIGTDFGDPEDPDTILLPDGTDTNALLTSAAVFGGIAVPEGMGGEKAKQTVQFLGKSQWLERFRKWVGIRPATPAEKALGRVHEEVKALTEDQTKTKEDLRHFLELQHNLMRAILANQGIQVPDDVPTEPTAEPATVAAATEPVVAAAVDGDGGKGLKDQNAELRAHNEALQAQLQAAGLTPAPPPAPAPPPTPGPVPPAQPAEVAPTPAPAPAPVEMHEGIPVLDAVPAAPAVPPPPPMAQPPAAPQPVATAPAVDPSKLVHRKSVDPQAGNGSNELVFSTPLNAYINKNDRQALRRPRR